MKKKYFIHTVIIAAIMYSLPQAVVAQKGKPDTLDAMRDFISVSTGYKQVPMYLEMEIKTSSNFITREDDTTAVKAVFYLQKENSYVRFGEFEQLVNDSMALLVSNKLRAMILYSNAAPVVKRMREMLDMSLPDSSIKKLAARYSSLAAKTTADITGLQLQSRENIRGTLLPKEVIQMEYETATRLPQKIISLKRTMLPLDSSLYEQFKQEPGLDTMLFKMEGYYFLVKEQVTTFLYKKIGKKGDEKIPAFIADRIMKRENGEYIPVKNFSEYMLTKND